jgi:nitric oxide reductase large subunit
MLLVQNLMLEMLADEEVVINEKEILPQALGGKRYGHVRGMGKYVIPTLSSSHSCYGTQVSFELEETKLKKKVTKLSDQLVENERKRDEQMEEMQNESKRRIEEIRKESMPQFDLIMSRILVE